MPEPLDLDAIEARANAATDGPWTIEWDTDDPTDTPFPVSIGPIGYLEHRGEREAADAEFVASAREDVPALVAEVRRLRAVNADLERVIRQQVAREVYALKTPAPTGPAHYKAGWDDAVDTAVDTIRSAATNT